MIFSKIIRIAFVSFLVMSLFNIANVNAQEAKGKAAAAVVGTPKDEVVAKEIEGTVAAISGNYLAVDYGRDPQKGGLLEMAFNLDGKERVSHKASIKEIKTGDIVKVIYEELFRVNADGSKDYKGRTTKTIVWLKAAPEQIVEKEEAKSNTESAPKDEAAAPSIPLKGLKGE
jgi:hypothetical protein